MRCFVSLSRIVTLQNLPLETPKWSDRRLALNIYRKLLKIYLQFEILFALGVSALRQHDAHLGQGTEDYFAESSALVLQTLSLEWSADSEILDAKLLPSEKAEFLSLLERRINDRIPTSYLLNCLLL